MDPVTIAASLRELAAYLRMEGDGYRAKAYDGAARTIEAIHDLERRVKDETLTELPGIGTSIARVVGELSRKGTTPTLEKLRAKWPHTLVELAQLPGVGLKRARSLIDHLRPADLDELVAMVEAGRAREVSGFGKVTEAKLLEALRGRHEVSDTLLLLEARRLSRALAEYLATSADARSVHVAGATRRWHELVDELVLVVATDAPAAVGDHLRRYPLALDVVEDSGAGDGPPASDDGAGDGWPTLRVRLAPGARARLVLAPPARVGAAVIVATGSDAHVSSLAARARAQGRAFTTLEGDEAAVYAALGVPFVPPEVRDGDGEVGLAWDDLVTLADVRGAVHCHTEYSDGRHTVAQMAAAADARGLGFLTITDHSRSAYYANGLDDDRLHAQWDEIAEVQRTTAVRLMRGVEADILADGALDVSAEAAGELDVVIASIHNRHKLDEDGMTRRLVAAMRAPVFKIWGHALGRMLPRRPPIAVRFDEVLDAVAASRVAIEINGDPHRLDLDPVRARTAAARGARFVLSSDAHSTRGLDDVELAVAMARRARLRPAQILNCLPADDFAAIVRPVR
jgi:DNA polymerase (family 10)